MAMHYLKGKALVELRTSVDSNLERYRALGFSDFFDDHDRATRKLSGRFSLAKLNGLKAPQDRTTLFDAKNSAQVFSALHRLTPMQAREERIWVYLCHFNCLEYMRARWPIPDDDQVAVDHILTHYFAPSARAIERDNGISRLWWMGFIADRAEGLTQSEALDVLMYRADVRANVIERPTTGASVPVFSAVLRQLKSSFEGKKLLHERTHFRAFMKEINSTGGVQLLDSLSAVRLDALMDSIIADRLGLTEI